MFVRSINFWSALVVIGTGLAASATLWMGGGILNTRQGGDSPFLLQRTYELARGLRAGALPVRWMSDAAYGFGYPFFNFYAALPYYLAATLDLLGLDLLDAVRLTQTLGMLAAGLSMRRFAGLLMGQPAATIAAAAYMLAPFHLVNLYVRGDSLSEFWAFAWFPLILHGLWQLTAPPGQAQSISMGAAWLELTLALAALVATHNVSALLFAPFIMMAALVRLARPVSTSAQRLEFARAFGLLTLCAIAAVTLSAWFWLPALGEAAAVQLTDQTTGYFNYANHFRGLNLVQTSAQFDYNYGENPFSMGLVQAIFTGVGLAALWCSRLSRNIKTVVFGGLLLSTILMTPLSNFIWQAVTPLQLAQFPWRLLSVQSVFCSLAVGAVAQVKWTSRSSHNQPRQSGQSGQSGYVVRIAPAMVMIAILGVTSLSGVPNERLDIRAEDVTARNLQLYEWVTGNIGTTIRAEYLPESAQPRPFTGPSLMGMRADAVALAPDGDFVQRLLTSSNRQTWLVLVTHEHSRVVLPITYWRGWHARVEALGDVATAPDVATGWLSVDLPRGEHQLELAIASTPLQRLGTLLFAVTLFAILGPALQGTLSMGALVRAAGTVAAVLIAVVGVARAQAVRDPPAPAAIQSVDFAHRPFPNRAPLVFASPGGERFVLMGARVDPTEVAAGMPFTITLTWQNDRAPSDVFVLQQSPSGVLDQPGASRIFRFEAERVPLSPLSKTVVALPGALPGPLLLQPGASHNGQILGLLDAAGQPNNEAWLVGPTIVAGQTTQRTVLRELGAISLHQIDWLQQDDAHVCIRPQWSARSPVRAALQARLRLLGSDGREVARVEGQPIAGIAPTWSWQPGVLIKDSYCNAVIMRNGDIRAGEAFRIEVVWYRVRDLFEESKATLSGVRDGALIFVAYEAR